jgi:phosphatidylglycerophosphate synthase
VMPVAQQLPNALTRADILAALFYGSVLDSAPTRSRMVRMAHQLPEIEFVDDSLLRPSFMRVYFERLFTLLPDWLPANYVTLSGFLAGSLMVGLASLPTGISPAVLAGLLFACIQVYVVGDHLDGLQALATGTASPLGEFLDHYCDSYVGAMAIFAGIMLVGASSQAMLLLLWVYYMAFGITYVQRQEQSRLHFTRWGALEAIAVLTLFFASWTSEWMRGLWMTEVVYGIHAYWAFLLVGFVGGSYIVVTIVKEMGYVPLQFAILAVVGGGLSVLLPTLPTFSPIAGWLTMTLFYGGFIGRVMEDHVVRERRLTVDPFAILGLCVLVVAGWGAAGVGGDLVMAWRWVLTYLAAVTGWQFLSVVLSLRSHWVWVNPD